jgi:putative CocE/NonD family hydrolase
MNRVRTNLRVPGAGGTRLATDVYLPDVEAAPVVVTRTPYGRHAHRGEGLGWRENGFGYVVQDVRGRHDSDGVWLPYQGERADGIALAEWVRAQPWCDGKIIAAGASYGAYTAWAMATGAPGLVSGVISQVPAMGWRRVKFETSGLLRLAEHAAWWVEHADARTSRDGLAAAMFAREPELLAHLPVVDLPSRMWADLPNWTGVITHRLPEEVVADIELAELALPTMHIGGWYDLLVTETLRQWHLAGSALDRRPARTLLVGPWEHELCGTSVGSREHGPRAQLSLGQRQVRWIRGVLAEPYGAAEVEAFLVGANRWWRGDRWPPSGSPMVLHAAPGALTLSPPERNGEEEFTFDPADPFPSRELGFDRGDTDARPDAVRYSSAPLPEPLTIAGTPRVHLHATADAPGADWVVHLVERRADETALALARGSAHENDHHEIELTPVALTVPAGSRLELEIAGGDFPRLARNLGTGKDRHTTTGMALSRQIVRTGPGTPTRVILPIVEEPT